MPGECLELSFFSSPEGWDETRVGKLFEPVNSKESRKLVNQRSLDIPNRNS